ncbi:hypothetical protein [Mucilaginibacter sp.]|uniref:hypothetical protein n=1 Tax=Mucilaginibacter sp. TaxID=1882438 RepID=UPI00283AC3B8|nr:hypothetical protein [Mucilaginibacter sp.]MDR3697839.1 hypothetical protein [Mucilaginibacter sp.]
MVEIFKTNVTNKKTAARVLKELTARLPAYRFNFDLEDCDRILRVQSNCITIECGGITGIVKELNVEIFLWEDSFIEAR